MNQNKVTSITLHTTSEGQRASYTYSVIDMERGTIVSENNRKSIIILDTDSNADVLAHINAVKSYVEGMLENDQ